jgi:hypothetical protein
VTALEFIALMLAAQRLDLERVRHGSLQPELLLVGPDRLGAERGWL